jgi:hypothetical protein
MQLGCLAAWRDDVQSRHYPDSTSQRNAAGDVDESDVVQARLCLDVLPSAIPTVSQGDQESFGPNLDIRPVIAIMAGTSKRISLS